MSSYHFLQKTEVKILMVYKDDVLLISFVAKKEGVMMTKPTRFNLVLELMLQKRLEIECVNTAEMQAVGFTKALVGSSFASFCKCCSWRNQSVSIGC